MNEEIEEYYEELYRLYIDENQPLERRYRQLRESLERVVREKIQGNSLQTTDLAARINYVATQYGLDLKEQNQLHTFRLTSNDILNHRKSPVKEEFLRDLRVTTPLLVCNADEYTAVTPVAQSSVSAGDAAIQITK